MDDVEKATRTHLPEHLGGGPVPCETCYTGVWCGNKECPAYLGSRSAVQESMQEAKELVDTARRLSQATTSSDCPTCRKPRTGYYCMNPDCIASVKVGASISTEYPSGAACSSSGVMLHLTPVNRDAMVEEVRRRLQAISVTAPAAIEYVLEAVRGTNVTAPTHLNSTTHPALPETMVEITVNGTLVRVLKGRPLTYRYIMELLGRPMTADSPPIHTVVVNSGPDERQIVHSLTLPERCPVTKAGVRITAVVTGSA